MEKSTKVIIVSSNTEMTKELGLELSGRGINSAIFNEEQAVEEMTGEKYDLVLVDVNNLKSNSKVWDLPIKLKKKKSIPVIALVFVEALDSFDSNSGIDDFILKPHRSGEVAARVKQSLIRVGNGDGIEVIKCGDLAIDLARCEVSVDGKLLMLTYKEYELLKFLVSNKGRVFTRETLLNKVWGYDYYGGERTVDVHVRRLRGKLEDNGHPFIETVRNIGYRFISDI